MVPGRKVTLTEHVIIMRTPHCFDFKTNMVDQGTRRKILRYFFISWVLGGEYTTIRLDGLFTLAAATAMETQIFFHQEWVTLELMKVFTWRPAARAMAIHRVQYNPVFPLPLPQSV